MVAAGFGGGGTHGCMGMGVLRDGGSRIWGFGAGDTHGCLVLCYGDTFPPPPPHFPPLWAQVLQAGRFSAVWRGTLQQRPVAIKAFAEGAARRWAAERAVHELPLMEHENVAKLLGTRGAGPCARGGLLVLQLYPAVSAGRGDGG